MTLTFELDLEEDGRFIAEIPELPGVMVYGATEPEAIKKVKALALRVLAEMVENDEPGADEGFTFAEPHAA